MTHALHVTAVPWVPPIPSPLPAHTFPPSHLSTRPAVSVTVTVTPPTPHPHSRLSDCWLVVPGDLRPVSMPPEYNWMAEAKEPSMGKRGSRGTHTHKYTQTQALTHLKQVGWAGTVLSFILSLTHFSSSSGYPWWCGCVRDTYLPGMYLTEWQININARKLHLYSCSGNEGVSMSPIVTSSTVLQRASICIQLRILQSTIRKSMNNIKAQYYCQGLPFFLSFSFSQSLFSFSHLSIWIINKLSVWSWSRRKLCVTDRI